MRAFLILLLSFLVTAASFAQPSPSRDDYERVLVPIAPKNPPFLVPGAHGSKWESVLTVRNTGDEPVEVFHSFGIFHCLVPILCSPGEALPPHRTLITSDSLNWAKIFATMGNAERGPGALMHVERGKTDQVFFDLLVREVTSAARNQGTRIPLIREDEMFTRPIELLNIGVSETVRGRLRLYSMPTPALPLLRVEMYPLDGDELLGQVTVALRPDIRQDFPHFADLLLESPAFNQAPEQAVRLRITPLTDGFAYWAFVSLTNNDTQLISIVTPE